MEDRKEFGSRIRVLRESRGLTIEEAAEQCDASVSIWRQYERGERMPPIYRLKQMCLVLRQKPEYFLGPEMDELQSELNDVEKVKEKIGKLQPYELEIVDTLISKFFELRE